MDLIVFLVLVVLVVFLLKDIKWVTYLIGIVEIFLRLVNYIGNHLGISELESFINKYIPDSLFTILAKYSSGLFYDILSWILVLFLVWFLIYLVNALFRGR